MISFIQENWRLLLEAVLVIVSFVFCVFRKRPVKVVDTLREIILRLLPGIINAVEIDGKFSGDAKKTLALKLLSEALHELHLELDDESKEFASQQIEVILSTPQKKGVNYGK